MIDWAGVAGYDVGGLRESFFMETQKKDFLPPRAPRKKSKK
jgi:hypothetical protein